MSAGETKGVMHVILHMSLMRVAERQFSNLKPINQEIGRMAIHIGRREILCTLASAAVAWPLAARAQQRERMRRMGVLMAMPRATGKDAPGSHRSAGVSRNSAGRRAVPSEATIAGRRPMLS